MDTSIVFRKTNKGTEEIETRKYGLPMTLRRGLILVDGKADVAKIIEKSVGVSNVVECLEELHRGGFITANDKAASGTPARSPATAGDTKTQLIQAAVEILGQNDAAKVIAKIERAPDTHDGLVETLNMCKKLVKLTIDEKKADRLLARCEEILGGG